MYIMVDVESDGPYPPDYSMISFGAVSVDNPKANYLAVLRPISDKWLPEALAVSGYSREDCFKFGDPLKEMQKFVTWLDTLSHGQRLMFISDNNGYDWSFMNYYFWKFIDRNPFGHSSTNLGSLYKGLVKNTRDNFKHLRKTRHTHNPVDDAMGNVEAFLEMKRMGLR